MHPSLVQETVGLGRFSNQRLLWKWVLYIPNKTLSRFTFTLIWVKMGKTIITHPVGNVSYKLFMVIWGIGDATFTANPVLFTRRLPNSPKWVMGQTWSTDPENCSSLAVLNWANLDEPTMFT